MSMGKNLKSILSGLMAVSLVGCGGGSPSISVLPSTNNFTPEVNILTAKMDILWVIDNSGSMFQEQQDLRDNFESFITSFAGKGFDYRMAVITTDAWYTKVGNYTLANSFDVGAPGLEQTGPYSNFIFNSFDSNVKCQAGSTVTSSFVDGDLTANTRSNYVLIDSEDATIDFSLAPSAAPNNIVNIFAVNSNVGIVGCNAESGLESVLTSLEDTANMGGFARGDFPRADAHLAIILVSDEEDQLVNASGNIILNPTPVSSYDAALKAIASSDLGYSFHSIVRLEDTSCGATYTAGHRYQALSDLSEGVKASICGDFAVALDDIARTIIEQTVEFKLNGIPADPNGLQVSIKNAGESNFSIVPQDGTNGWTYKASANSIVFHGTAIPGQGSELSIIFDPNGL